MKEQNTKVKFQILAIIAIIVLCIGISPIGLQNDTFYTVKIGEHILENRIDGQDPFSWHEGLSYTYPHWLYDVGMYLIYQAGGWLGIYISTVVLCCVLGITIYLTLSKLTKNKLLSFALTIGVMLLMQSYIAARAQLPTFILFVLTIYFIERFLETKKKRYAVGLIIIPILIANLHVAVWPFYFVLYLPYIVEYLLCVIIDLDVPYQCKKLCYLLKKKLGKEKTKEQINQKMAILEANKIEREKRRKERREHPYKICMKRNNAVVWLIVIFLICLLTGLLTPLGDTPYTYLIKTMQGNTTQNINEHLPLTLINQKDILCIIAAIIALLMLTKIKIRLSDLFLIGGLILLCLMSRRQISMLLILGVFVVARLICYFLDKYDKDEHDRKKAMKFCTSILGEIIILVIIVSISYSIVMPKIKKEEKFISTESYPVAASDYILDNLDLSTMRLYNEYNYGSYLLYRGIPVFIDSRADLYTPEFNPGQDIFSDFLNISNIGVYYETKFEEYHITHVILYKNAKLNLFLSRDSNYELLYSDDNFVLYQRLSE